MTSKRYLQLKDSITNPILSPTSTAKNAKEQITFGGKSVLELGDGGLVQIVAPALDVLHDDLVEAVLGRLPRPRIRCDTQTQTIPSRSVLGDPLAGCRWNACWASRKQPGKKRKETNVGGRCRQCRPRAACRAPRRSAAWPRCSRG